MMTDVYDDPLLKMMIYGKPGCGKTTLIGTSWEVEKLWPMLYLNVKGNPSVLRKNEHRPEVITVDKMQDFNKPYDWLVKGQKEDTKFFEEYDISGGPYNCLVVDAITEVQRHVVRRVVAGEHTKPGDLLPLLGRQGFGQLLGTMLNWSDLFLKLPMNVILVSHESTHQDTGYTSPLLWGQSGMEICSQVLLVMRLLPKTALPAYLKKEVDANKGFNVAQVRESLNVYAKDQYELGSMYIEDPTMKKVMDLIEQGS